MSKNTQRHILDVLRTEPPSLERDRLVLSMVPEVIKQIKIWGAHLEEALNETVRMNTFGKNPVKTCEEGFVSNQALAIGCCSR